MSEAKKCDRCGKLYENVSDESHKADGFSFYRRTFGLGKHDLCPSCTEELHSWFEHPVKREKTHEKGNSDELHDKCQTCVSKVKYQDDTPCCDCDPKNGAEMYEPEAKEDKSLQLDDNQILYRFDSDLKMFRPTKLHEFQEGEFIYSSPNHVIGLYVLGK